ncbi:MAG TPA: amidohydrolase [Balneola sp.]|nr:N-acyl-L-amino acid amidohydrolase [Balneola sp.]MAO77509.1 N-acyl-L-amino acid amidohydrolase [Balneola sp.]MBF66018.1 N-acyl-L-amino acid amidohydrolase [Balneola sp.]HAH50873.1 amidohydrolase [Balneola sp.]HBZ38501.1 amidohydrolase [Balneola sp.]|tara:strand:- start:8233 stop:9531 length:1299 start_codon:yes stop_codon:yes gene_type:complete
MKKLLSLFTLSLITLSLTAQSSDLKQIIDERADELEEQVIEWRRYFHENPELSNREFNTAKKISEHLESLGLEVQTEIAHTGVMGILKGGKPGPVVGLRADIDALPVIERTDVPFKSTVMGEYQGNEVGVMHACGHDTHIAILMGVAQILTEMKDDLQGTVKFIFQPAEEGAPKGEEGGAELMVKEGVLKNPDVEAIFGLHISDDTPVGELEYRPKGIMASVNSFDIKVTGKQAHGSAPWAGIDPIVTSAQIINNIQTIVSRSMPLTRQAAVVTVGVINGGVRNNIIPEEVTMQGTIRALDEEMRQLIFKRLKTVVQNTAESNGATAELTINKGYPITYNDPELTAQMLPTLVETAGKENVKLINAITGAEDFSFFQNEIPGLYFFVGGKAPGREASGHHTPDFYIDESGLKLGVRAMSNLVIDYMDQTAGK